VARLALISQLQIKIMPHGRPRPAPAVCGQVRELLPDASHLSL